MARCFVTFKKLMKTLITICFCCCLSAWSETRIWTFKNGETIEGKHISLVGQKVTLSIDGDRQPIPLDSFSDEDIRLIQLLNPPKLDFEFTKKRERRRFPAVNFGNENKPQAYYYNFDVTITQASNISYPHELYVELFVIGREAYGHNRILIDYVESSFSLDGLNSSFQLKSKRKVELYTFLIGGDAVARTLGQEYDGYLVIVKDSRGEVIAHRTTAQNLFENLENLSALPIGAYFDKTCTRCSPTRPKPYGY